MPFDPRYCIIKTNIYSAREEKEMGKAPNKCPMCGEMEQGKLVDTSKKGFSVGKAAAGGILLGPVGLVGGALGKKKKAYYCGKCGFNHEY